MINRVLIRIKVVQMLYCYLLTQGDFKLKKSTPNPSRDNKYAYSLYCDLLQSILLLSGFRPTPSSRLIPGVGSNKYLAGNRIAKMLQVNDELRQIALNSTDLVERYGNVLNNLYDRIVKSAAYRSYTHTRNTDIQTDVKFWTSVLQTEFAKDPEFAAAARRNPDFTVAGFESGIQMAVDSLEELTDTKTMFINARKSLEKSLDQAYLLYHALLSLPVEITRMEDLRLENGRNKFLATAEDLNPNTKFVDNQMVQILSKSEEMEEYFNKHPFNWADNPEFVRSMLDKITASDIYKEYMESPERSLEEDCAFWRQVMKKIVLPSDDLAELLESTSVYWNDDIDIVGTFALKSINRLADYEPGRQILLPQYKDEEDANFGGELFVDVADHFDEYRSYIDRFIDQRQWDSERLAFMDVVIMATAISEMLNYPAIPLAVSLNEYIEIANCYSTPKSGQFVNGILYSVINYLKEEGKLNKN